VKRLRDPENAAAVFVLVALVMIGLALLGGVFLGRATKGTSTVAAPTTTTSAGPVDPKVAAGAHDFVNFACAQCHGLDGQGGVSPFVPALKNASKLTDAQLTHIINHGLGESANPKTPYMPVWGQVISPTQVDALVAYIHAGLPSVPTAQPVDVPTQQGLAVQGRSTRCTAASTATARTGSAASPTRSRPTRRSRRFPGPPSSSSSTRTRRSRT